MNFLNTAFNSENYSESSIILGLLLLLYLVKDIIIYSIGEYLLLKINNTNFY